MSATASGLGAAAPLTPAREGAPARAPAQARPLLFYALMGFFVLEYVRPPVLPSLRLQMLFVLVVPMVWFASRERPWNRNLTLQALLLAFFASGVLWAHNYFNAYLISRLMFGFLAVALAINMAMAERSAFQRGMWFWVAIMVYQALHAVAYGGRGTGGFIGDENDLALACATAFPLCFVGMQHYPGWRRWACAGLAGLLAIGVVASFSRGGFVSFALTLAYCVLTGKHRLRNIAIGAVGGAVLLVFASAEYRAEMGTITETRSGTAEVRLFLWTAAFNMWKANPVMGVGPASNSFLLGDYQPEANSSGMFEEGMYRYRSWSGTAVHSLYFETLADLGLVGAGLLGSLIGGHFLLMRRLRRQLGEDPRLPADLRRDVHIYSIGLSGAVVAYLTSGIFLSITYYPYVWYLTAMGTALESWSRDAAAASRGRGGSPDPPPDQSSDLQSDREDA